jgi:aldehyde dehydrogenase (NAD+)
MEETLRKLGLVDINSGTIAGSVGLECQGELLESVSPIDGRVLARVRQASSADYDRVAAKALQAFL